MDTYIVTGTRPGHWYGDIDGGRAFGRHDHVPVLHDTCLHVGPDGKVFYYQPAPSSWENRERKRDLAQRLKKVCMVIISRDNVSRRQSEDRIEESLFPDGVPHTFKRDGYYGLFRPHNVEFDGWLRFDLGARIANLVTPSRHRDRSMRSAAMG